MTATETELCNMLADCVSCLEYVERHHPDVPGYAVRWLRTDAARALIERVKENELDTKRAGRDTGGR